MERDVVSFQVRDVYFPELCDLLTELHGDDKLQGEIIGTTRSGDELKDFVVVKVSSSSKPITVIVPADKVRAVESNLSEPRRLL